MASAVKSNSSTLYRISAVSRLLGLSADTLRYYEKISLLPKIQRSTGGVRLYSESDLSRLRFIRRAQSMNFTLAEISELLKMREDPQHARDDVRELTHRKLAAVKQQLTELGTLRKELQLLVNLCTGSEDGCPIIDGIDAEKS